MPTKARKISEKRPTDSSLLIDAHNHLQDPRFRGQQSAIIRSMREVGVAACVVNGTEPDDWLAVAELADNYPDFVLPSFGLHPWKVKDRPERWLEMLREALERFPRAGVGEFGLDRWIKDHDFEDQRVVFRSQLNLAGELKRTCSIHCLKAWGPLLEELGKCTSRPRFLVHSFGGSMETARELVELGAWFSFSGYFLHPRKQNVVETFRQLPKDRILVETDAPDMLPPETDRPFGGDTVNHPANVARVRNRLIELVDVTSEQLFENTKRCWPELQDVLNV